MTDSLPSWNDGSAKRSILDFVARVTTPGPDFLPVAERIAAFDNDGTLWVEVPLPPQFDFVLRRWRAEVEADPALADRQPYKGLLTGDREFLRALGAQEPGAIKSLVEAFDRSWAGSTPAAFEEQVREWMVTGRQPTLDALYVDLVYVPMIELFDLLKANGFRVFVCSGGGRDFMRVFAEETWGIHREYVIGSSAEYVYRDGALVRGEGIAGSINLGARKPESIFAQAGRMPALASGNADGDIEMLSVAAFALLVNHDDADREFAYTSGAEESLALAERLGWTVVSMRQDWNTVFADRGAGG